MVPDPITRRQALVGAATVVAAGCVQPVSALLAHPLQIAGESVRIACSVLSPHTVRIAVLRGDDTLPGDGAVLPSINRAERRTVPPGRTRLGNFEVEIADDPTTIAVFCNGKRLQQLRLEPHSAAGTLSLSFSLGSGPLLGLGQGGPQFDRRGTSERMISGQAGYELGTHGARVPIQFLLSTEGWALFVHQPLGSFDLTGERGFLQPHGSGSPLPVDLFLIHATEPATILREYAAITGFAEMPPLWSLGYQQSYRTLGTPEEILAEARTFREKKLPCDTLIYLGTGFCPEGWNTGNGEFAWNPAAFPDPAAALAELHREHFKVALHVVLEGHHLSGTVQSPCTTQPPLPSGRLPNGTWPPDREVSCYWPFHKPLVEMGVDGWWPDQGDGFDAPSRLARNRMYFEGQQMYRPDRRVYALHRNGYAGMQRYATFLWSGDTLSRWETLATHVANAINTGLSGVPYWGTDIGGFVPTEEYTGELYARWFQFGAFCPLFRSHGRDWKLHRPWGWSEGELGFQETPGYHPSLATLHDPRIEPICRTYLELRSRLQPYLYTAVRATCDTGLPVIRSLWLHDPGDPAAAACGDTYLFGPDLLVAPVVEKAAAARTLYLPSGLWHDWWTGERQEGGRRLMRGVELGTLPLYVRAGAVLPLAPVRQYTGEPVPEPVTLTVYPGADGVSSWYEDDGETFAYRRGEFRQLTLHWQEQSRTLTIRQEKGSGWPGAAADFHVQLAGDSQIHAVHLNGTPLRIQL